MKTLHIIFIFFFLVVSTLLWAGDVFAAPCQFQTCEDLVRNCDCGTASLIDPGYCAGSLNRNFSSSEQSQCLTALGPEGKLPPSQFRLPETGIPTTGGGVLAKILLAANWIFAIFVAISVIFIVMSAFEFVTAQGDPAKVTKARMSLIYAVIGIALALLAAGIPQVLRNIVV